MTLETIAKNGYPLKVELITCFIYGRPCIYSDKNNCEKYKEYIEFRLRTDRKIEVNLCAPH